MAKSPERVVIFGGAGNWGALTVDLFQDLGYETLIVDPKVPNSVSAADAIRQSRLIFFSVLPIENISKIILGNLDSFNENHIVFDNATEKRPLVDAYRRLTYKEVPIVSTHPLCKSDQPLPGQLALVMQVGRKSIEARSIGESIYSNAGMRIVDFDFDTHDESLLAVQIPHLVQRIMGRTFERMGVNMKDLRNIATANFNLYELSLWRTLIQDPQISATIVANFIETPKGQEIIGFMRDSFEEITNMNDRDELAQSFKDTYAHLGGEELGPGMNEKTITVLERLANLGMKSFSFSTEDDTHGSLVRKLRPIARRKVSITAVDSHRSKGSTRFDIGIEQGTSEQKLIEIFKELERMGCTITERSD